MRQLVAILFTDIVGYSRQMDLDEAAALRRLDQHNRLMDEVIARHEGRVIKTVGDAYVVVFQSSVTAVECALDAQRALELHNAIASQEDRIQVRMGIHVGDVVIRDGDLFGEAVNIAARLEGLAPPGGICVTRSVLEQVRRKVNGHMTALGEVQLKNISKPMALFVLRPGNDPLSDMTGAPRPALRLRRRWHRPAAAAAGAMVLGLLAWAVLRRPAEAVHRGGVLRIAVGYPLSDNWNIYKSQSYNRNFLVMELVADSLLFMDNGNLDLSASLLDKVVSEDGATTLKLSLRPGIYFHDHPCFPGGEGRLARAGDVVASIEAAARYDRFPLPVVGIGDFKAGKAGSIAGITTSGALDLTLKLSSPAPFYEEALSDVWLQPGSLGNCRSDWPIGTGPFRFPASPRPGNTIVLEAARHYWYQPGKERRPILDRIEVQGVDSPAKMITRLAAEERAIDILMPDYDDWPALFDLSGAPALLPRYQKPGIEVAFSSSRNKIRLLQLECITRPEKPLSDPRIRRAIALALDRSALVRALPSLLSSPATRFMRAPEYGADAAVPELRTNLEAAKALLAEAGHPGGKGIPELLFSFGLKERAFREALVGQLAKIGIQARIEDATGDAFSMETSGHFDGLLLQGWDYLQGGEAVSLGTAVFATPGITRLNNTLASTASRAERAAIYNQIETSMLNELNQIPIGWVDTREPNDLFVVRKRITGFYDPVTRQADFWNLAQTSLEP